MKSNKWNSFNIFERTFENTKTILTSIKQDKRFHPDLIAGVI